MKITRIAVMKAVMAILECPDLKRATVYLDDKTTVKCTRYRPVDRQMRVESVVLTFGRSNYAERKFIKLCKKAGQKFPVGKSQLKWFKR